jgi:hypothetical protein
MIARRIDYDFHLWQLPLGMKWWGTNKNVVDDDKDYLSTYLVKSSGVESCSLSETLDASSASDSRGDRGSIEGMEGRRAMAFQPLWNEAIAATNLKSETQTCFFFHQLHAT